MSYPAVADLDLTAVILRSASEVGDLTYLRLSGSADRLYEAQGWLAIVVDRQIPVDYLRSNGVLDLDIEAATLLSFGMICAERVTTHLAVIANRLFSPETDASAVKLGEDRMFEVLRPEATSLTPFDRQAG